MKTQEPYEKQIGIWLRVSTADQAEGDSPEHHEKRARLYAEAKGWQVKEVYHLEGVSGKSVMEHPECRRMLEDVRKGRIQALVFSKLARLARNTKELLDFADIFRENRVDLISLQESIDTSTPAGRLFYSMVAAMAQWEREEIADRIKASVSIRAKLGKPLNGKAPFGYHFKDRMLVPHPQEAPIRKLLYEIFLETGRIRTTAVRLNKAGYRTRNGSKFGYQTVKRLLRDTTAKGVHIINRTKNMGRNTAYASKPRSEWTEIPIEAIIPIELWEKANAILDKRSAAYERPGRPPVQLFSGLTYCHCGQRMYPRANSPKYICSRCKSKIPIETLDGIFYEQLKGYFLSKEDITREIERATQSLAEREALLENHRRELAKVNEEMERVYGLFTMKQIDGEGFARFYKPLEIRKKQLDSEEPRLQAEVDVVRISNLSADLVVNEATVLYSSWPEFSFDEKRRIVESIVKKIVIGKEDVVITLCDLPSSEELTKKHRMLCGAGCGTAGV